MPTTTAKKENGFDRLARLMQEGFVELETNLRKEFREALSKTETNLRQEMHDMREEINYRMAESVNGIYRRLDRIIEPKLDDHEHRITKLEKAR